MMTQVSTFTYDEAVKASDAAERGYSTLKFQYSRPGRIEKFLRKRLNKRFDQNLAYRPGDIHQFTVKARRYRIFCLVLPYDDNKMPAFIEISRDAKHRQFRFFDNLDEALHARAMRDLPQHEPKDLGHLKHKAL